MTTTTTPARIVVVCSTCGHKAHPETPGECQWCPEGYCEAPSQTWPDPLPPGFVVPKPAPFRPEVSGAESRWTALRDHITWERDAQDEAATGHAELGNHDRSERAYGAVEVLDRLLAAMDRMEAGQ